MRTLTRSLGIACLSALVAAAPAAAQEKVKIGFITTLSGPQGVIGEDMKMLLQEFVKSKDGRRIMLEVLEA